MSHCQAEQRNNHSSEPFIGVDRPCSTCLPILGRPPLDCSLPMGGLQLREM